MPRNVDRDQSRQQNAVSSNNEPTYTRHVIIEPEESDPYDTDKRRVFVADNSIKISTEAFGRPRPPRKEQSLYTTPKGKYSSERDSLDKDLNQDNTRRNVKYQDDVPPKRQQQRQQQQQQEEEEEVGQQQQQQYQNRRQYEQGRRTNYDRSGYVSSNTRRNKMEEGGVRQQTRYQHQEEEDYREKSSRHPSSNKQTEDKQKTTYQRKVNKEERENKQTNSKELQQQEQDKEERKGEDKTTRVLILDIEVEKGKIESLEVFEGNDPLKLATDFCNKFSMDPKYIEYIADQIRTNLSKLNQSI